MMIEKIQERICPLALISTLVLLTSAVVLGAQVRGTSGPVGPGGVRTTPPPNPAPSLPRLQPGPPPDAGGPAEEIVVPIYAPRPLDAVLTELKYFGVPLSYEEPTWLSPDDVAPLVNFPDPRNQRLNPNVIGPAPASLLLQFQVDAATKMHLRTPIDQLLRDVVARHNAAGNPGEFRVIDLGRGQGYSIVPVAAKSNGQMVSARSPLDVRITLETKERTALESFNALTVAVSQASGMPIVAFEMAMGGVISENHVEPVYKFGANNEVAREVLTRLLYQVFPQKMAWRLYYQPRNLQPPQSAVSPLGQRGRGGQASGPIGPAGGGFHALSLVPVSREIDRSQMTPDGRGRRITGVMWPNWPSGGPQ